MSLVVFLASALVLGIRHALDPDHVVAVSVMAAEQRRLWPAARLGIIWGLGHMLLVTMVGIPVLFLRLELPAAMEQVVDLAVGLMLIFLGVRTGWRLFRERIRYDVHGHRAAEHGHFHAESHAKGHNHPLGTNRSELATFLIGGTHGLAGSGAVALLALSGAPTAVGGLAYLLSFGFGTCVGMFMMTLGLAAPTLVSLSRFTAANGVIRAASSVASLAVGLFLWYDILPQLLA